MMELLNWPSLLLAEKIFASIGLVALAMVVLQLALSFLGGGGSEDYDMSTDHPDVGHSWSLFSIRGLFGFLLGLGWVGLSVLQRGGSVLVATLAGALVGLVIAVLLALMMKAFHSMRSDGTIQLGNAVGVACTVYQRIPARREGFGKVQVIVQGRLQTLEACTDDVTDIAPHTHVTVTQVVSGSLLLVQRQTA